MEARDFVLRSLRRCAFGCVDFGDRICEQCEKTANKPPVWIAITNLRQRVCVLLCPVRRPVRSNLHVQPIVRKPLLFPKELVPFVILTDYLSERSVMLSESAMQKSREEFVRES